MRKFYRLRKHICLWNKFVSKEMCLHVQLASPDETVWTKLQEAWCARSAPTGGSNEDRAFPVLHAMWLTEWLDKARVRKGA